MIPSTGKDSDSSDKRKAFSIIIYLFCSFFRMFIPPFSPSNVVVVFIGTKKTN